MVVILGIVKFEQCAFGTATLHGVKRIEDLKVQDGQVAEDLEMLRRALEA